MDLLSLFAGGRNAEPVRMSVMYFTKCTPSSDIDNFDNFTIRFVSSFLYGF